jgi:hypothetical protein
MDLREGRVHRLQRQREGLAQVLRQEAIGIGAVQRIGRVGFLENLVARRASACRKKRASRLCRVSSAGPSP